jgi:hypothetical protein
VKLSFTQPAARLFTLPPCRLSAASVFGNGSRCQTKDHAAAENWLGAKPINNLLPNCSIEGLRFPDGVNGPFVCVWGGVGWSGVVGCGVVRMEKRSSRTGS